MGLIVFNPAESGGKQLLQGDVRDFPDVRAHLLHAV